MRELEELLKKAGFVRGVTNTDSFEHIETLIGFKLPDDYKFYLNNYDPFEDFIGKAYVLLYSVDDLLELNKISFDDFSPKTIAIGTNGDSKTIGIRNISPNSYKIVIAQNIQDVNDHITIGSSFTDMIRRLSKGAK